MHVTHVARADLTSAVLPPIVVHGTSLAFPNGPLLHEITLENGTITCYTDPAARVGPSLQSIDPGNPCRPEHSQIAESSTRLTQDD